MFNVAYESAPTPAEIRQLAETGALAVLGEITNQYAGIAPDDKRMEPDWAVAEELDVPVGIHIGTGPPGAIYLGAIVEAGFGKRVMFGSDQMVWPGTIERGITVIREAPFLSKEQKRDILYNNAARFLRLSDETIARHHGM